MKKSFISGLLLAMAGIMTTGCAGCQSENKEQPSEPAEQVEIKVANDYDGVISGKLNAGHVISMHRQNMYNLAQGKDFRWFETTIELADFLDSENQDGTIKEITSVFQTIEASETGCDTWVQYIATNATKGTMIPQPIHSFWMEDSPLDKEPVKITFEQALEKLNQVNSPKPHSRYCVLRKEVGPKDCNPQYIFGNSKAQLYVDAVTGDVSSDNPAFGGDFGMPLGEWP